ncbi:hypothetical protein EDD17DRAFT_1506882 [Pisolithus thermaeus]|nr:hypothetical protein EDD17DRAFT_1506882 [Pisolithus thermaeus]
MFGGEGIYWIRSEFLPTKFVGIHNNPYVHGGECSFMPIGLLSPRLTRTQLWLVEQVHDGESFIFRNYDTGTVLGIENGSSTPGTSIVLQSYASTSEDTSSQRWEVIWVRDNNKIPYYCITNQRTRTVLDQTENAENGAGFSVESWNFHGCQRQLWSSERATFPTMYWLITLPSRQRLQYIPNPSNTTSLDVKTKFPSRNQLWYLESVVEYDGYYRIRHVDSEDRVLDLSSNDNESILARTVEGGDNQMWKITNIDLNGIVSIVCARNDTVLYAHSDREGVYYPRGATDASTCNGRYQWCLDPLPIPSLFWTAMQCRGSGKFVAQSGGSITASNGARGEGDYTAQWRFVTQSNSLRNLSGSSLIADNNPSSNEYYWALDCEREDYIITNLSTSNVIAWADGNTQALSGGARDVNRHWFINAVIFFHVLHCFIFVSYSQPFLQVVAIGAIFCPHQRQNRHGTWLRPKRSSGSVMTDRAFNSYRCQWIFQQVGTDTDDRPIYVIINKLSDKVLDHWGGVRIEALDSDPIDPHHQWRLVPCHNNATGTMTDEDRRCCWTLVSRRDSTYDTIDLDIDITTPYLESHHIVKRIPKKLPKGKGNAKAQPSHIPNNPRIIQATNRVLRDIVELLISQLDFDRINDQPSPVLASTSRTEVVRDWCIDVPRTIQAGWECDGWVRIGLNGIYMDQNGVRVANIQGQYNAQTRVSLLSCLVCVTFGRQRIREAMAQSLEAATSVRLDAPENTTASGPKKQPTTTQRPPGPGVPLGQYWAATAVRTAGIELTSLTLLTGPNSFDRVVSHGGHRTPVVQ